MRERFEHVLDLQQWNKFTDEAGLQGLLLRTPSVGDLHALAELMLETYRDTIDYEGGTIVEAVDEVQRYLVPGFVNKPSKRDGLQTLRSAGLLTESFVLSVGLALRWKARGTGPKRLRRWSCRAIPAKGYLKKFLLNGGRVYGINMSCGR